MTDHAVLIKNRVAAMNVDSYNRSAKAGSSVDLDNGYVFRLDTQSSTSGETELWTPTAPTANGSTLDELWMACSPEISWTSSYRDLTPDPRQAYNPGGSPLDAFRPAVGDIVTISSDGISGSPSTGSYVVPESGSYIMKWSATQTDSALALKLVKETYISIGTGAIDNQRKLAYKLEVVAN